jgi:hypothetical protein
MSDEIYVNTGTSFQQPFNDRTPLIVNTAVTAQRVAQAATNTQQPYPYIAAAQTTYQASAQQPYPYTANRTISYPYIANAQTPYIANNQTPFPYIANGQQPYIAAAQQPYPYTANSQTPYIANGQQPYPYTAAGQQPYIANAQQAYSYTANAQTSYTADGQQPYPYIANQPITYPYIGQGRQPSTYQHQEPGTYARQGQTPYPYIASQPTTYPYIASAQTTYQANAQQPYPYTANAQTAYTANGQQPYPYTANAQTPSIANAQQPYPYTATSQTPYIASAQQPYPYIANGTAAVSSRTPYAYDGVDGDDSGASNTDWGPGDSNATIVTSTSYNTTNRDWVTALSDSTSVDRTHYVTCQMKFSWNGSNVAAQWYGVHGGYIGSVYADTISYYSPFSSAWTVKVKWNGGTMAGFMSGGIRWQPSDTNGGGLAKNTYYTVWDGTTGTTRIMEWYVKASSGGTEAQITMSNIVFTLEYSRVGYDTITTSYSHGSTMNIRANNTSGGGPL